MTAYECLSLTVGVLTLLVLSWTLIVLMRYARDTKKLAWAAAEQLPRPRPVPKLGCAFYLFIRAPQT